MKNFTSLFIQLDETNKTSAKLAALKNYLKRAPPSDAAWAVVYLTGRRPKTPINAAQIRSWATAAANIPEWLFTESYDAVGDLAETVSLLLPIQGCGPTLTLTEWLEKRLFPLAVHAEECKREAITRWWNELDQSGRFVFTKLLTGAWRVGVSQRLVTRALAEVLNVDSDVIAHRLMGKWHPDDSFYAFLSCSDTRDADLSKPYPFYLAYPFDGVPDQLGSLADWQVEWKWDGIRAQVIKRQQEVFIWSRGEELVTERFPEIAAGAKHLPDGTVLDGEILAWTPVDGGSVQSFGQLQRRLGRKTIGKTLLKEVPVVLMTYDLLEWQGKDIRTSPLYKRRLYLEELLTDECLDGTIFLSPVVLDQNWQSLDEKRQESRNRRVEGFVLKAKESIYGVGRKRGDWWKWKIEPYSVDAVLLYAQRGSGRRASLYSDYTFGIWQENRLVPLAKAYSGLSNEEIREVDRFVRRNTVEKFGPVRSVPPKLVMELHFEGIRRSSRHKSGVAVRFPRIASIRKDKSPEEADSIETVLALLPLDERNQ
ncbi:MAG: ATP-dependent DNA ligase [Desulfobacterales bacterium]|nr:ATP-dependent DNA ligase [Deltaproteobacteria bacterium]MBT8361862.1 ATP-dependent DNA ligase [Deltaproteobacteria bacterium]NNK93291.1 ATP-dependent DNA ligase [Desulfobacterales bacterium]